ncbi:hypothetical protein Aperf_G00000001619 [Anoplocephala perfoliata]
MCALEKRHEVNIIHMDIEPNSVLIRQSGHIVLAEFDHSPDISSARTWTNLKHFRGNLKFMAAEVANKLAITTRADPPFKPKDIVRFADYGINPRDANILSAALDERFPDLTYSPENQGENFSILEGVQHDPDDIQRAGFTSSRLEELFAHSDFMDFNFFEYIREESRRLRIG